MSNLVLELRQGEMMIVNGAPIRFRTKTRIELTAKARFLFGKQIMAPEQADSPARRIYFPVMMMYLDEAGASKFYDEFVKRLNEFMGAISNPELLADCIAISKHAMAREYYKALMLCRKLIEYEDERLSHVASGLSKGG